MTIMDSHNESSSGLGRPTLQKSTGAPSFEEEKRARALQKQISVSFNDDEASKTGCCAKLRGDRFKPAIPTSEEELKKCEERHGEGSWQLKCLKLVNSEPVQKLLVSLLLCDVIILFIELYLDAAYPSCHTIARDAISCCPANCTGDYADHYDKNGGNSFNHDDGHRFLGGSGYGYCEYPLKDTDHPAGCDDHKYEGVHTAHGILFGLTVAILSIFMLEIVILMITLGPRLFFSRFLYVLDFLVVGSSLALEIVFATLDDETTADVVGLLVVFRLWRFIRIGHGLIASTHEMASHKMDKLKSYTRELEKEVIRCGGVLPESKWSLGLLEQAAREGDENSPMNEISVQLGGRVLSTRHLVAESMQSTEEESKKSGQSLGLAEENDSFVDDAREF